MRIAVISDTHDRYPPHLSQRIQGADEIWHLGDVSAPAILDELSLIGPPLHVVQGNCDFYPWPTSLRRRIHDVCCQLVHAPPPDLPREYCDILLHGHTHIPRDQVIDGIHWLNPGSVSLPRGGHPPSFGWLTIGPDKSVEWSIEHL
ncbi:putative phosphoesterase [Ereboglobus sp. PH5-10]|uniref:metallophosphoesterase family protein n=1 Tax=Ereboglobus sp. PH5-10 TaxID=2940629 RepID=UPI002406A32A|nr:YfcE family phosphodiesterase [Ereboglobus sp. PH5-10]MDF9826050.1 putative phosphoesterase [Ereboglobus sp. PH5-10]